MAFQPYSGARRFTNPEIYVESRLYTLADNQPFPARNRKVDQTLNFVDFMSINDGRVILYHHDTSSNGPDANPLDQDNGAPVDRQTPYQIDPDAAFEFSLEELAGRFDIRNITRDVMSDETDQVKFQVSAKARAIRAAFGHYFINGVAGTPPGAFTGLKKWTDGTTTLGQLISAGAGLSFPLSAIFNNLDEAIFSIETNDRDLGNLLIVCNSQAWKAMMRQARQINGTTLLSTRYCRDLGYESPHYMGIPICFNDHIEVEPVPELLTDIYVFDRKSVMGLVNKDRPDIRLEQVQSGTNSAVSHIVSWYVGLASFTDLGLVRVERQELAAGV